MRAASWSTFSQKPLISSNRLGCENVLNASRFATLVGAGVHIGSQLMFLVALTQVASQVTTAKPQEKRTEQEPASVAVDVVVSDGNGRPVKWLREQDFQLVENHGRRQIRSFTAHEKQAANGTFESPKLPENAFTNAFAPEMESLNVIFLDQMITSPEHQQQALEQVAHYIDQKSPGSYFAVFVYRRSDTACQSCDGLRMVQGITANKDLLIGGLRNMEAEPKEPSLLPDTPFEDTSLRALAAIGNFLKDLPGRKQLIWLSDAFDAAPLAERSDIWFPPKFKGWQDVDPTSPVQTLRLASSRLAMSRVAVYPVDLTGKGKKVEKRRLCFDFFWYEHEIHTESEEDSLYTECKSRGIGLDGMAAHTGGRAFHGLDSIQEAMAQAVDEGTNHYTLSYVPAKGKLDGKLRNLKITIDQKDYEVRFRQRYWADDPVAVYRPGTEASPDVVLSGPACINPPGQIAGIPSAMPIQICGDVPLEMVRVTSSSDVNRSKESIDAAMRYGGPELTDLPFSVQITANGKPRKATAEQMAQLANFQSFRDDSVQRAMLNLTKNKKTIVLNSLPAPDEVYLQSFSLDCSTPASDLKLTRAEDGKQAVYLEIAVLAFDERGKKVVGLKDTISIKFSASELERFGKEGFHHRVEFDVPERGVVLRVGVHDISQDKLGAVEIPVWAIKNPFRRQRLHVPALTDDSSAKKHSRKTSIKSP